MRNRTSLVWELAFRMLKGRGSILLSFSGWISLVGLVLGVACLVISMAVMSGFERTLRTNLSDVSGDLQIFFTPRSGFDVESRYLEEVPGHRAHSGFLTTEGVFAFDGRIRGALLQGMDHRQLPELLRISKRLIAGRLPDPENPKEILIGKGIAHDMGVKPGDDVHLVVLIGGDLDAGKFRRKMGEFRVAGVLDLGKYEFDQRMIFLPLTELQVLLEVSDKLSGYIIRLDTPDRALEVAPALAETLGPGHRVRTWKDLNENIFEAVVIEKIIVFFVILIIVFAACFNVMSSLLVSVYQRFHDIALLKALGFQRQAILKLFQIQGFLIGFLGSSVGLLVGVLGALAFEWAQREFGLVPGSVYKLDSITVRFRWEDIVTVMLATNLIAIAATWLPARKGADLPPVEGLRYE